MSVRAKFKVAKIERGMGHHPAGTDDAGRAVYKVVEMQTITLAPVYANNDPNHENSKFWKASPSGSIVLGTVNPEAWSQFELDKEYYVDFTLAEPAPAPAAEGAGI
jgi:hypothetical protein